MPVRMNIPELLIILMLMMPALPAVANEGRETVVILHGIARTASSMEAVEVALRQEGYETLAITYPSTKQDIAGIAAYLRANHLTEEFWNKVDKVHFVTHSMGGLVTRAYLDEYRAEEVEEKLGRVVMLGPPNGGSEIADLLYRLPPYNWYYGPAGRELTTAAQTENKSEIYYDLGVIAGTKEWPYIVAAFVIPGKSDGRVAVEKTKIEGMKDHVTVNGTHTFIMDKPEVHEQILHFLKEGTFRNEK